MMNQTSSPYSIEEEKHLTTSTCSTARNSTIRKVSSKKTNSTGGYVDHSYTDHANVAYDDLNRAKGNHSNATDTNTKSICARVNKTSLGKGRVNGGTLPFPGKVSVHIIFYSLKLLHTSFVDLFDSTSTAALSAMTAPRRSRSRRTNFHHRLDAPRPSLHRETTEGLHYTSSPAIL